MEKLTELLSLGNIVSEKMTKHVNDVAYQSQYFEDAAKHYGNVAEYIENYAVEYRNMIGSIENWLEEDDPAIKQHLENETWELVKRWKENYIDNFELEDEITFDEAYYFPTERNSSTNAILENFDTMDVIKTVNEFYKIFQYVESYVDVDWDYSDDD